MNYSQKNYYLSVSTPLGDDKFFLKKIEGEEYISKPFFFRLTLGSNDNNADFSQLLEKSITVTIRLSDDDEGKTKIVNGVVTRLVFMGMDAKVALYYAELRPWFWLLEQNKNCKIFQNQKISEIISSIFSDRGFSDYQLHLSSSYEKRDYCVQYEESDMNFISRLLEDEGIFYYFTHETGKHTLVLRDDSGTLPSLENSAEIDYRPGFSQWDVNVIHYCHLEERITPTGVKLEDYNFETPGTDLLSQYNESESNRNIYEYYNNFTKKTEGDKKAKIRVNEYKSFKKIIRGGGNCREMSAGFKFKLKNHDRADMNGEHYLTEVYHSASLDHYSNTFLAIPADVVFRPSRKSPKPYVHSIHSAVVVGKSGEEIWTDRYGRIKVQFHWDQYGDNDENSSCWIRVNQGWAGKNWGAFFLPRIGMEVLVSFISGDPDKPIVMGSVYNAEQAVPYELSSEQTKSAIKSNSSKGGGGSNEIRFEDKKDSEEVYIHAQKDETIVVENDRSAEVKHDDTATIKNNRSSVIQEGNESVTVSKGNREITVSEGNETHSVKGTRDLTVTGNESHTNEGDYKQDVKGNFTLKVDGNITIEATGSVSVKSSGSSLAFEASTSVSNKAGTSLTQKAGTSLSSESGTDMTHQAGTNLTNKAGISLENKGTMITSEATATHDVKASGILTLKGSLTQIN